MHYEFTCPECGFIFEISTKKDLKPKKVRCPECIAEDITLTGMDPEMSLRIRSLWNAVEMLADKIDDMTGDGTGTFLGEIN